MEEDVGRRCWKKMVVMLYGTDLELEGDKPSLRRRGGGSAPGGSNLPA